MLSSPHKEAEIAVTCVSNTFSICFDLSWKYSAITNSTSLAGQRLRDCSSTRCTTATCARSMSITVGAKVEVLNTWNAHVGSVCTVVSRGSCWIRVKNEDEEEFGVRGEKHLKLIEAAPELEEKPLKRRCTEKPAERLADAVVSKPQRPPARYKPALAITNQATVGQFGPHIAGASAQHLPETNDYAKPVRLDGPAFEIKLLAGDASASVKLEPFLDTDEVVQNVLTDMGATYMPGQRSYTVKGCHVIGKHFVAPGYLERLGEDVIEKLSSVVVPSDPEMCVCLHRAFLRSIIHFDDDNALMEDFKSSCEIFGGVLRRNRVRVVISKRLFAMRQPITELARDRSQKAFDIVKSLEEESKVKVDVFGLFTCEGCPGDERHHELAKAAVDFSEGEVDACIVEQGATMGIPGSGNSRELSGIPGSDFSLPGSETRGAVNPTVKI